MMMMTMVMMMKLVIVEIDDNDEHESDDDDDDSTHEFALLFLRSVDLFLGLPELVHHCLVLNRVLLLLEALGLLQALTHLLLAQLQCAATRIHSRVDAGEDALLRLLQGGSE